MKKPFNPIRIEEEKSSNGGNCFGKLLSVKKLLNLVGWLEKENQRFKKVENSF